METTKVSIDKLELLGHVVIGELNRLTTEATPKLEMVNYHGFLKAIFPDSFLENLWRSRDNLLKEIPREAVQLEVVYVGQDLTDRIHCHHEADAAAIDLSAVRTFPPTKDARVFIESAWYPFSAMSKVRIPAGQRHGFTVAPGGCLWFLSIQSPPIVRGDGHDDYYEG